MKNRLSSRARLPFSAATLNHHGSALQCPPRNILPVMRAVKTNLRAGLIGAAHRRLQIACARGYSQHSAACRVINPIALRRTRMKYLYAFDRACLLESVDSFSKIE